VHSEEEAIQTADRLGYPVAVKPADGNHGRGVSLGIESADAVRKAFAVARGESKNGGVIVENLVAGKDYRVLVIGGTMAALAERVPAQVVGDGSQTVEELVTETNRDPRRGIGHENVLTRLELDEPALELLAEQGYQLDDVPPEGEVVKLRLTANLSTGGTSIDRTLEAHPENVEIAESAARVVGLDVAGGIGDDEAALVGGEIAVGDVDGDPLLAFGGEPVDQQGEIDAVAVGAVAAGIRLEGGELILEQALGIEQQPPDQRRLAVVDAAAGQKAQQAFVLVVAEEGGEGLDLVGTNGHQK
jgi:hypothetical protein